MEATAFGLKWIVEALRDAGVPCRRFCAGGGLPAKSPLLMQIYADVLDARIFLPETDQSVAMGAAILGCLAAGSEVTEYASISQAIHAMSRWRDDLIYRPSLQTRREYEKLYPLYRSLTDPTGTAAAVMRRLRGATG
jgi:L-ribulokinase